MITVGEALRAATERLSATSDTARLDAELLMAHAIGVARPDLLLRHMRGPAPDGFASLVERRAAHEPIAYIVAETEFFGRVFAVSPAVLIPRPDSESVVGAALEAAPAPRRVLDCGVGSGALLLTILAERPEARGIGIDRSAPAIGVAETNARSFGLAGRARMMQADWSDPRWSDGLERFDLIVGNPPYVEDDADLERAVHAFEPHGALYAGADGLADYRTLVPQLPDLLDPGGVAVLEIGHTQADAVSAIAATAGFSTELRRDLAGRPRALILRQG